MSLPLSTTLRDRWASREHVGAARPTMEVKVRKGYLQRVRRIDGSWTAEWTPTTDYKPLPGVSSCSIEQSFDSNGIATCTLEMANVAYVDVIGAAGLYHHTERGWFSPYRSYQGRVPGLGVAANEWNQLLATAAQVTVWQGYGDQRVQTFTGLLDSINGGSKPPTLTLVARDFGQLLTDCHMFGWNIDPNLRDPTHFYDRLRVEAMDDKQEADRRKRKWVLVDDLSGAVKTALTWAGLPEHTVRRTGARLKEPIAFGRGEYLIDVIRKAQDVTGYTFFMGEPTGSFPLGQPIFRRSNVVTVPAPVAQLRDSDLLTGLNWQRSDEPLAGIIRVRGKATPYKRGGVPLGGDSTPRIMGVYRPPWHVAERDARLIRHVIHYEPLFETSQECLAQAQMIALQEALAAVTATIELPTHPGLQLDDIISIRDSASGLATRAWIAQKQTTFEAGKTTRWRQSLGVALLDTPDVVQVVDDLGATLTMVVPETEPVRKPPPNVEVIEGTVAVT